MTDPNMALILDIAVVMLLAIGVVLALVGTLIVIRDFRDDLRSRRRRSPCLDQPAPKDQP